MVIVFARSALLAGLLLLLAPVTPGSTENAPPLAPDATERPAAFPPSAVTIQDKIDWLTGEADAAVQAVDAEAEKPLAEQREALYRAVLARGMRLVQLVNTLDGRFPRLEARANEVVTSAAAGLERIANGRLKIGMSPEQVREIRGEPSIISEATNGGGVRQQWRYGATVLVFENGTLTEIRQMLKGE